MTAELQWRASDEIPRVTGVKMVIQFAGRRDFVFEAHAPDDVEVKLDRAPPDEFLLRGFHPAAPDIITGLSALGKITGVTLRMKAARGHRIVYDPRPGQETP